MRSGGTGMRATRVALTLVVAVVGWGLGPAGAASAATIRPTTTGDTLAADACSLRGAVLSANENVAHGTCAAGSPGHDVIELAAGTYRLTRAGADEDAGRTGDLDLAVPETLTITGAGRDETILDGDGADRVLHIAGTSADATRPPVERTFTFRELTLAHGAPGPSAGGCLMVFSAILVVDRAAVRDCSASHGGGVWLGGNASSQGSRISSTVFSDNASTATAGPACVTSGLPDAGGGALALIGAGALVTESTFRRNSAAGSGGAILLWAAPADASAIDRSTFTGNVSTGSAPCAFAPDGGGAVYVRSDRNERLRRISRSTFTGNRAAGVGGAIALGNASNRGAFTNGGVASLTVVGNVAQEGGGVWTSGNLDAGAAIIAANTAAAGGDDASGPFTDLGGNVIGSDEGAVGFTADSTLAGSSAFPLDPRLAPLADNGGRTETMHPMPDSPATSRVPVAICDLGADQRGVARPQDAGCESGAVEIDVTAPTAAVQQQGADPTNVAPVVFDLVFSEPVDDFEPSDVSVGGSAGTGAARALTRLSDTDYRLSLVPVRSGELSIDVTGSDRITDHANNPVAAQGGDADAVYDVERPRPALTSPAADPTGESPVPVVVFFDEPVTGFDAGDVDAGDAAVVDFTAASADRYTFGVVPVRAGLVTVKLTAGAAQDAAGNPSQAATLTRSYDPNDPPAAAADGVYATDEDTALHVAVPGVLGNDTDPDDDPLTAVLVAAPAHGSLTLAPDGSFVYTPEADFSGDDSFTYRAADGEAESGVATVSLRVAAVDDAPAVAVTGAGRCASGDAGGTMVLTVTDVDGPVSGVALTASSSDPVLVPPSRVTFSGDGATRTMTVTTASGATGTAVLTVRAGGGADGTDVTVRADGNRAGAVTGTPGADLLLGRNGTDTLAGLAGVDLLCGGNGDDRLDAGDGADGLEGANGDDRLTGGSGPDRFGGGNGADTTTDYAASEGDTRDSTTP